MLWAFTRPAATLARRASEFESEIYLRYDDNLVNAKVSWDY